MPGKSLNEWNCTQEGDFSLADELTGKQRRESLQNQSGKRKTGGQRNMVAGNLPRQWSELGHSNRKDGNGPQLKDYRMSR